MFARFFRTREDGRLTPAQDLFAGVGGLLLMFVVLLFSPYFMLLDRRRESRLRRDYSARGRLVKLQELRSIAERGILLVEIQSSGCFGHLWWLEDAKLDMPNCPLPVAGQTSIPDATKANFDSDTCHDWSVEKLSKLAQNAALVDVNTRIWAKDIPSTAPRARMIDGHLWWHLQNGSEHIPSSGPRSRGQRRNALHASRPT